MNEVQIEVGVRAKREEMIVVFRRRGCGDGDVKPIAMMIENGSRVVGPLSLTKYCSSPEGGMIPARLSRRQSGFRKAEGATELTLETPGVGLALAFDYYRIEAFETEADRDLACGSTAHEDVRYFPIGREELIRAGNEIQSISCGHTLDHPDFEQVFAPIFDAALRYLVSELIQTPRPKNGPIAATMMSIARARYTITVVAAEDWFNFNVGGLCLFEKIDPELLERTARFLEEQLILHLSPPVWRAKPN